MLLGLTASVLALGAVPSSLGAPAPSNAKAELLHARTPLTPILQLRDLRPARDVTLRAPSAAYPTLQSAIDAAPDGATIRIAPGEYREHLFINGKHLRIIGSDHKAGTALVDARPVRVGPVGDAIGLINYANGAGGRLENLRIEGGDAGIVRRGEDRDASLRIRDVAVSGSGRGVLWDSAGTLTIKHSMVSQTVGNGIVLLNGGILNGWAMQVVDAGQAGIYIANSFAELHNELVGFSDSAGIFIYKSGVEISGGSVFNNNIAGLWAIDSSVSVDETSFYANHAPPPPPGPDAQFGDGVVVILGNAWLTNIVSASNDRAGVSFFGAHVKLTGSHLQDNVFDLNGEVLEANALAPGFPAQDTPYVLESGGGNTCDACVVQSSGIPPPENLVTP